MTQKDELTKQEQAWVRRLQSVLNDIPMHVEISLTNSNYVEIHRRGVINFYFKQQGDTDEVPYLHAIKTPRFYPRSETV